VSGRLRFSCVVACLCGQAIGLTAQAPADARRQFYALGDFRLESGTVLPDARMAYATWGTLTSDRSNAVLLPSWYGSDYRGYDFLIGPGRALDPAKYFIVVSEMFADGASSSPSNTPAPFDRGRFPAIAIRDDVEAAYRLLTDRLGIAHVRAVIGFSMGAQQAFQWAVGHPDFMDQVALYCGAAKTYPHGVVRLESAISALTADPAFGGGEYTSVPVKGMTAWADNWSAWIFSQEWWRQELFKPRSPTVDAALQQWRSYWSRKDANDLISQARTWQHHNVGDTPGYLGDHERALRAIKVPVLYMPSETDLYFPVADAHYESQFIPHVTLVPIPSVWGHEAGVGTNPPDNQFIDKMIRQFLK
jgi:homoserine O-acetyltransferase/O-succinyltransferase